VKISLSVDAITPYSRYPAILRGSPIICGFDAIDMVISWVAYALSPPTPGFNIRQAASRVLLPRFSDNEGKPDLAGIARLKVGTRRRWMAFLIGVLPQLIKLYASQGVVWSQAAGTMYLASWFIF
jgi:hypothetical protein